MPGARDTVRVNENEITGSRGDMAEMQSINADEVAMKIWKKEQDPLYLQRKECRLVHNRRRKS